MASCTFQPTRSLQNTHVCGSCALSQNNALMFILRRSLLTAQRLTVSFAAIPLCTSKADWHRPGTTLTVTQNMRRRPKPTQAGAKLAFHEGGSKYKLNGDGTYTVVNEPNGVYDSNPPQSALVRVRTLQEARHLTIEAAIEDYINDACSGTFPDDRVHCTKATAATQLQAASPKPTLARGAAPSDGTCTPAPEWPHMNRCPVSEQVFVDAYVRVNSGRDGLDLAQLKQLGRDEYTMSTGLTGAPTMLLGQYMPTARGQRAMEYLVYGPYGQHLRPRPAPQTTASQ